MEFGAFIDLESIFTQGSTSYVNSLPVIIATLYRQTEDRGGLSVPKYEQYDNFNNRASLFNQVLIYEVYGAIHKYLEFRETIFSSYKGLFQDKSEDEPLEDIDLAAMSAEERKEIERNKRVGKWSYELLLFRLASNDPLRMTDAASLPVVHAFNLLGMMQELGIQNK